MSENNKAIVRRYIEEAYNKGNVSVIDETYAPDCLIHWVQHGMPDERGLDASRSPDGTR